MYRLDSYASKVINHNQTGFIRRCIASDNICWLLHIIDSADISSEPIALFSPDPIKAFDRLECGLYLRILVLDQKFKSMIKVLYNSSTACVTTGSKISLPFKLERGTSQRGTQVNPVRLYGVDHHISLFADDILLFLSKVESSVPHVLKLFDYLGYLSVYRINWDKSILMLLNNTALINVPQNILIKDTFTYLGIHISPRIARIVKENYVKVLKNILTDIQRWNRLPISLQGRVNIRISE